MDRKQFTRHHVSCAASPLKLSAYRDRVWLSAGLGLAIASAGFNNSRLLGSCAAPYVSVFADRNPARPPYIAVFGLPVVRSTPMRARAALHACVGGIRLDEFGRAEISGFGAVVASLEFG